MTKQSYTVDLQTLPLATPILDDQLERIVDALERDRRVAGPAVETNLLTRTVSATLSADATDPERALELATGAFDRALQGAGITAAKLREVSVELDAGDGVDRQEFVTAAEVARRLGVSRERVRQLAEDTSRFPASVGNVRGSRVWRWGDIADWIDAGGRRGPGRPTADAAALGFALSGNRNPEHRAEMLRRLCELASAGDKVAIEYLEANPRIAFFDSLTRKWVEQMDSRRGPGLAVGARGSVVRTR